MSVQDIMAKSELQASKAGAANETLVAVGNDFNSEVVQLLQQVLVDHPDRKDLRLKLLKLHYEQGDTKAFVSQAEEYQKHVGDDDDSWDMIHEMAYSLKTGHALFSRRAKPKLTVAEVSQVMPNRRMGESDEAVSALKGLAKSYAKLRVDPRYIANLDLDLISTVGRPTPLLFASRLSKAVGGANIYIKRDDFSINYARLRMHLMGQAWIASELGMRKVVYATESGYEAVLAARAAAHNGLKCALFVPKGPSGCSENERFEIELIGAEIREVTSADSNDKLRNTALDYWLVSPKNTFMMLNLNAGPHPYPTITNDIQAVIGRESYRQLKNKTGGLPKGLFVRGGQCPDAIGFVDPFLVNEDVDIVLVTPDENNAKTSARLTQQIKSYQSLMSKSVSSTDSRRTLVEYTRLNREMEMIEATGRVTYEVASLANTWNLIAMLAETEGMVVPFDSACVLAQACEYAKSYKSKDSIIVLLAEGYQ